MEQHVDEDAENEDLQHQLEDLFTEATEEAAEDDLADRLEALLGDEVQRQSSQTLRRDVARRTRIVTPSGPTAPTVELDAAVVDAVTLAVDASIERLLPGLVEEAVARALAQAFSTALPRAIDDALPAAIEQTLPPAIAKVLPEAIEEAITEVIEHLAPASPALERATDALRRLRERTTPRAS